jgi:probable phosphoglycerate mutase
VTSGNSTRLIVWRHGNTDWNRQDRVQGQLDAPLNDLGRAQATAAAAVLADLRPDAIVSSDLSRAAETAAALAALTGLPVAHDERLRERYFGRWQGRTLAEAAAEFPDEFVRWRAGEPSPGSDIESQHDLGKRVGEALLAAVDGRPGATVVAATHGGGARHGIGWLLDWPPEVPRSLAGLGNCRWAELWCGTTGGHGWRLWSYNVGAPA